MRARLPGWVQGVEMHTTASSRRAPVRSATCAAALALLLVVPISLAAQPSPDELRADADRLYADASYEEARDLYLELRLRFVDDARLHRNLGWCFYHAEPADLERAIEHWRQSWALIEDEPSRIEAARAYRRLGQWEAGADVLLELTRARPERPRPWLELARLAESAGATDRALEWYAAYLSRRPDDVGVRLKVARLLGWRQQHDRAIAEYEHVLQVSPGHAGARAGIAQVRSWQGQFDTAIRLYRQLLGETPEGDAQRQLLEALGRVYGWAGQPAEAIGIFERLRQRDPTNMAYALELGRLQIQVGNTAAAREWFMTALAADPDDQRARIALAELSLREGDYAASGVHFDHVLMLAPRDARALFGRARTFFYQGEVEPAYQLARDLVDERPTGFDALFLLANLERLRGNRESALALLARAADSRPDSVALQRLTRSVRRQAAYTLRLAAAFGRERGRFSDLHTGTFGATLRFAARPGSRSAVSASYLPTRSPVGGIRGSAGPWHVAYEHDVELSPRLSVRGRVGVVRFTSGDEALVPGQPGPVETATTELLAAGGLTFEPNERVSAALDLTRTAVTYTPTSSRLGVMRNAVRAGLSFALDPRTSLYLDYSYARFAALGSVQDRANYAVVAVTRNIHSVDRWSLDVGYRGQIRSHSNTGTYLGYYNPDFNQSHTTVINVRVTPAEPVSLALRTRLGVQVRDAGESVELGSSFRPSVTIRAAPRVAVTFAYSRSDTQDRFDQPYETDYFSIVTNWGF